MANNFVETATTVRKLGGNEGSLPNINTPLPKPKQNKNNNAHNLPEANSEHPQKYLKNNSLPEGWRKVQLKKNPKVIWYENEETQNRSWVPPGQNNSNLPLNYASNSWYPKGWRRVTHKNNNANVKAEWYEHNSGETAWELPEAVNNNNAVSVANNANGNVNSIASDPGAVSPSAANLKKGLNDLSEILNTMENTLKQKGGRAREGNRRKGRKTRKGRKSRKATRRGHKGRK
jgi:hypothetical protein